MEPNKVRHSLTRLGLSSQKCNVTNHGFAHRDILYMLPSDTITKPVYLNFVELRVTFLAFPTDSKPTKDAETNPRPRLASQPRNRKTKVSSTVTRPGGHGVNVASASPVDKYMNGSLYDRDGKMAKPRVVTGESMYKIVIHWPCGQGVMRSTQPLLPQWESTWMDRYMTGMARWQSQGLLQVSQCIRLLSIYPVAKGWWGQCNLCFPSGKVHEWVEVWQGWQGGKAKGCYRWFNV